MKFNKSIEKAKFKHHDQYVWSNESYRMYDELFAKMKRKDKVEHILAVGGGDHIIWALAHTTGARRISHIDVSAHSLVGALTKFAMILHGSFDEWYAFTFMSIPESTVERYIKMSPFGDTIDSLGKTLAAQRGKDYRGRFHGLTNTVDYGKVVQNRIDFFLIKDMYDTFKENLQRVEDYDLYVSDVWEWKCKHLADLALLSNAYHWNGQPKPKDNSMIKAGGYLIYTERCTDWWPKSWELIFMTKHYDWTGHLYRRAV